MVDVARVASPSEARSPLPPVPSVGEGCAVGVPGIVRAVAASTVPMGAVGSSLPAFATEPASAIDPLSAPEIDEWSGWFEDSEGRVRFGSPGSFFAVAPAPAERPDGEAAAGSGVEVGARSEPGAGVELRTGSGLGARSGPAAGIAVEVSGAAEAWWSAPGSAAPPPSAASGEAGAAGSVVPATTWAGVSVVAGAAPVVAAGASVASAVGATTGPGPAPDAASSDAASSVDGEPGEPASPRRVTRTRAGVPM